MRILVSWLRELAPVNASVKELADILTMRGFEVSAVDAWPPATPTADGDGSPGDDAVLDLEITTNRPDCLNVAGIAREVGTVYDVDLRLPEVDEGLFPSGHTGDADAGEAEVSVTIEDPELCPRYAAAVAEIAPGPSPAWLADRLLATGIRPINNVVDITNYVMIECGHPMHAFDLDRLEAPALQIRLAIAGERLRTLDGQERTLGPDMLVIADTVRPQAVAGVMGGAAAEVGTATRRVVFESAYFRPTSVRRTSTRLGLSTDASYRFERGADIGAPVRALKRAVTLLTEIGAGVLRGPVVDSYPSARAPSTIALRHHRITNLLGVTIDPSFVRRTLERLGFGVGPGPSAAPTTEPGPEWVVTVPSFRVDVRREVDLIEEIARHHGYDALPSTFPALVQPPAPRDRSLRRHDVLRDTLTAGGCSEAITYSFIEEEAARLCAAVDLHDDQLARIRNPLSEKYAVLRPSLLPGLLDSLVRNRRRERHDIRLFEIGKRFDRARGETGGVGLAITGAADAEHWSTEERPVDFFDLKALVERLCDALGVTPHFAPAAYRMLVPNRAAAVSALAPDGQARTLGWAGQLQPSIATSRGFPHTGGDIHVAELDIAALETVAVDRDQLRALPVPRHPSITRDLALLVDSTLPAGALRDTIRAAAPDTLVSVREFDRYEGQGIPAGSVSLALRLMFRAPDRTLTDDEVQSAIDVVVPALAQEHGATLR